MSSNDPLLSPEEIDRLIEIADLNLVSRDVDEHLNDTTRRAAELLGLPISLVSIVLDEAQYFAAAHGLEGWMADTQGTPVEWAFCRFAVRSKKNFVVENAEVHPDVKDNPLVTQDGIRSYLGVPLVTRRGHALGTLCVIGDTPRTFTPEQIAALEALAEQTVRYIEGREGRTDPG